MVGTEGTLGAAAGQEPALEAAAETAAEGADTILGFIPADGVLGRIFSMDTALKVGRVALIIVAGLVLVGLAVSILRRMTRRRMDARTSALLVKLAQYLGFALIAINAFEAAEVDLSALLGAAGIAGIALGFAAQTSVSNFISGFFLMSDKTFAQGDVLSVNGLTGVVTAVDALSVKLRTFDNQLVRIPNETLIKADVANVTRYPARRLDMKLTLTHGTDMDAARTALVGAVLGDVYALRKPEPLFLVRGLGDNGIDVLLGAWLAADDWVEGTNSLYSSVVAALSEAGLGLAYPTITVLQDDGAPQKTARQPSGARR